MRRLHIVFFIGIIFFSLSLCAQDSTSAWSIGVQGSAFNSYRILQTSAELDIFKSLYDSLETSSVGFQMGGIVRYTINENFDLSSGIYYQRAGYNIDTLMQAQIANMKFRYGFIRVPLRLHYNFRNGKVNRPFLAAGLAANYCVADKTTYTQFGRATVIELKKNKITGKIITDVNLTIGIMKEISPNTTFHLGLDGALSLQPLEKGDLARKLWNSGIWISLTHKL